MMANEHRQPTNSNSPELQGVPHMEQSVNPTLNDVQQSSQQMGINGSQTYQQTDKDWESIHRGPPGSGVSISNSSGSNVHGFGNETFVTRNNQRTLVSNIKTDLSFQNSTNLEQLSPVKMPPGFGNMSNGVSGNTSNGEYNNRGSFNHGSDNNTPMPVGSGYGR